MAVAEVRDLDAVFAALANETRREIVAGLAAGPTTTPEIGRRFAFSRQALNRHLLALEEAGLVERSLDGRVHTISLVPQGLDEVASWTDHIRTAWLGNLDRLGAVLGDAAIDGTALDGTDDRPTDDTTEAT